MPAKTQNLSMDQNLLISELKNHFQVVPEPVSFREDNSEHKIIFAN